MSGARERLAAPKVCRGGGLDVRRHGRGPRREGEDRQVDAEIEGGGAERRGCRKMDVEDPVETNAQPRRQETEERGDDARHRGRAAAELLERVEEAPPRGPPGGVVRVIAERDDPP